MPLSTHSASKIDIARLNVRLGLALKRKSASHASREIGMSRNAVSQFTAGKSSIKYENMLALCEAIGIPIGLLHRKNAISENKLTLYNLIEELPEQLELDAITAILDVQAKG